MALKCLHFTKYNTYWVRECRNIGEWINRPTGLLQLRTLKKMLYFSVICHLVFNLVLDNVIPNSKEEAYKVLVRRGA